MNVIELRVKRALEKFNNIPFFEYAKLERAEVTYDFPGFENITFVFNGFAVVINNLGIFTVGLPDNISREVVKSIYQHKLFFNM